MVNDPVLMISSVIVNFWAGVFGKREGVLELARLGSLGRKMALMERRRWVGEMILMIEDAKTDRLKRNVIEELNEIPLDDPNE